MYPLRPLSWSSVRGNNGNSLDRCGRLTGKYAGDYCRLMSFTIFRAILNVI